MKPLTFLWALVAFMVYSLVGYAQTDTGLKWFNPKLYPYTTLKGKAWQNTDSANYYNRLPSAAEKTVRKEVWNLAKNTAGEYIDFNTNAKKIVVKYQLAGGKSLDNMPTLGVSGLDLYAQDTENKWHWIKAAYSYNDTVTYSYENFNPNVKIKKLRLYLPLYNTPKWLKIGVATNDDFTVEKVEEQPVLVFYGTSIMQGASASRPGMAWLNILGRKLNQPVINLGFSGNGRLEAPLIDLMSSTAAKLFVLDCQPNLTDKTVYPAEEIEKRITTSVQILKEKHPNTPILLVEHSVGLASANLDLALTGKYIWTSQVLNNTYQKIKKSGVKGLYILTAKDIGFTDDSTIDGTHPNDLGMMRYADAYEKIIRKILNTKK
ncbi:hydrolase [Pedobacter sp. HDW13]|uniref:SGNH/GDSL hydrolase family protein n=1 Tax=unclassified Pedobacter TaxID=2628915 RepID=UPI001319F1F7|nr:MULTISPECIES: SGNH/GDSL hydrolase family protein [unclassified Pedobacter]QIL40855.1 hydrolase [Pedobacter sp. HDW13]